ncbi:MAG: hypothetical protein KF789_05450 [Bdellovibrionaceae bacterium]|nr:hypothetical protein [Pseudobdellovibrionaceae bacterium]
MKSSYSSLMQSKYFNPAFNSAIFDGPVRIYFAQIHESLALKIYFLLQQRWPQEFARAKDLSKASHANVLVMIYPTSNSFAAAMGGLEDSGPWTAEGWNEDVVMALRGPVEDDRMEEFMNFAGEVMRSWTPAPIETGRPALHLA